MSLVRQLLDTTASPRHSLNIAFSLGVKVVFVILTFAGFATLWGAIAADVGASLLVVANALRLLRSDVRWERSNPMLERVAAEHMSHGH